METGTAVWQSEMTMRLEVMFTGDDGCKFQTNPNPLNPKSDEGVWSERAAPGSDDEADTGAGALLRNHLEETALPSEHHFITD